jgi:nucleotide-binding universal stress UspA family protein
MKILLAVDGSEFTKRMLAYLAAHDELRSGKNALTLLTVLEPVSPQVVHLMDRDVLKRHYDEQADAVLRPITAFAAQKGWSVESKYRVGYPAQTIAKEATDGKFDLLVMGSHGHGAFGALLMGSVVSNVMARCKTPLLIVR